MKTAVVTDSTANLDQETIDKYGIKVVPIPYIIDGTEYQDGVDLTRPEFYEKMRNAKDFPTTSQPPVGEMINLYNQLADEGYDAVISIHIAGTISGLMTTLNNLKDQFDNIKLYPIDSSITEVPMGWMVKLAARMAAQNEDAEKIVAAVEQLKKQYDAVFVVDDLKNLAHGGRLSNASAFIGTVLKIKPLLHFDKESDKIVAFEKVRSLKKAMKRAQEIIKEETDKADYPFRLLVIHANNEKRGQEWAKEVQEAFPGIPVSLDEFDPVIAVHLGEGALALGFIRDIEKD
ncbi:DegV family protein [Ligilactobacillus araffinosus]|uniref:DegV family protein n=1 Tax=Ligilactobacillus araffinosus DSM 20653 TaxID=1423820 RepID=A0A0R1ZMS8_9LACO|nr:DegV family protein [Ligilactobacillus araffinosus]KRM52028.1 DegV family protein [Ligilactobacillus araffinosus DSM 20653]